MSDGNTVDMASAWWACAFCGSDPIPVVWPSVAVVCSKCGCRVDCSVAMTGSDDVGATIESARQKWNYSRQPRLIDRLLTRVAFCLVGLAKIPIPADHKERFDTMFGFGDADADSMRAAMDTARDQILRSCPKRYKPYLAIEFRCIDAIRSAYSSGEIVFGAPAASERALGNSPAEKTYTIEQLRGAWGAGFYKGRGES